MSRIPSSVLQQHLVHLLHREVIAVEEEGHLHLEKYLQEAVEGNVVVVIIVQEKVSTKNHCFYRNRFKNNICNYCRLRE